MLKRLSDLFIGKKVLITHTNERIKNEAGVCKNVYTIPGTVAHFDMELENGSRFGFVPEIITETSVDGKLRALAGGRRKIEI
jgi:hypothetical protein